MGQTQSEKDEEVTLEKKQADHVSNSSNPALTSSEQARLNSLQSEAK